MKLEGANSDTNEPTGPVRIKILANLCLIFFIAITAFQLANAQDYALLTLRNELVAPWVIVAGDVYDGQLYLQNLNNRANGRWKFVPAGDGYYYIIDSRHGKAIVAGDVYDGNLYHQDPNKRDNAKWKLIRGADGKFQMIDKKHGGAMAVRKGRGKSYDVSFFEGEERGRECFGCANSGKSAFGPSSPLTYQYEQDNKFGLIHLLPDKPGTPLRIGTYWEVVDRDWNLTIVDGLGSKSAPKELVLEQKVAGTSISFESGSLDGSKPGRTITLSATYANETAYSQSQRIIAREELTVAVTVRAEETVSAAVFSEIGRSLSEKDFGGASAEMISLGVGAGSDNPVGKEAIVNYKVSFAFETSVDVPAGKTVTCTQAINGLPTFVPFFVTFERTMGDGSTVQHYVRFYWSGPVFKKGDLTCQIDPE